MCVCVCSIYKFIEHRAEELNTLTSRNKALVSNHILAAVAIYFDFNSNEWPTQKTKA